MIKVTRIIKIHTRIQASYKLALQDFSLKCEGNRQKPLRGSKIYFLLPEPLNKEGPFSDKE